MTGSPLLCGATEEQMSELSMRLLSAERMAVSGVHSFSLSRTPGRHRPTLKWSLHNAWGRKLSGGFTNSEKWWSLIVLKYFCWGGASISTLIFIWSGELSPFWIVFLTRRWKISVTRKWYWECRVLWWVKSWADLFWNVTTSGFIFLLYLNETCRYYASILAVTAE